MNWSDEEVAEGPPGVATVTCTTPTVPAGDVALSDVALATVTPVAATPPKATEVAPATKPVPDTVTTVPPAVGPDGGDTTVTAGTLS